MILSLVSMTLLLLRNNCIFLYQSSNFFQSLLNYHGSMTILFSVTACMFLFIVAGASNISLSVCLFVLLEALFMIFKNSSLSDSTLILSILHELILYSCELCHMCFILCLVITLSNCPWTNYSVPHLLQGELIDALPNITILD